MMKNTGCGVEPPAPRTLVAMSTHTSYKLTQRLSFSSVQFKVKHLRLVSKPLLYCLTSICFNNFDSHFLPSGHGTKQTTKTTSNHNFHMRNWTSPDQRPIHAGQNFLLLHPAVSDSVYTVTECSDPYDERKCTAPALLVKVEGVVAKIQPTLSSISRSPAGWPLMNLALLHWSFYEIISF